MEHYLSVIFGAHLILYSDHPEADRRFLADVFDLESVDAGHGWLLFALPPAEVAVHPAEAAGAGMFLMSDDLRADIETLEGRGASCSPVEEARWGSITTVSLPGGGRIGLYQPNHPLAIDR